MADPPLHDPQTSLASRHAVLLHLQRLFARFFAANPGKHGPPDARDADPRSWLVLASLEGFTTFLDRAGSSRAEILLRELGATLRAHLPASASAGRLDATTFLVVLDDAPREQARRLGAALSSHVRLAGGEGLRLAVAMTALDRRDRSWRHPMTRLSWALSRARELPELDEPVPQLGHVGARTPLLQWEAGERRGWPMAPDTAFGRNLVDQWLALDEIVRAEIALGEASVVLELQCYVYATKREWGLRVLRGGTPLALTEERTESEAGDTLESSRHARLRSGGTSLVLATLVHEQLGALAIARRGSSWEIAATRHRSGAVYNTVVYDSFEQRLTLDLGAGTGHMLTSYHRDATS